MAPTTEPAETTGRRMAERELVDPDDHPTYRVPTAALLYAVVAGPFIWAVHLGGGAALASYQCLHQTTWPINLLTGVTATALIASMLMARSIHQRARAAPPVPASKAVAFIALVGLAWGGISLLATVLEGVPNLAGVASCPR